MKLVEVGGLSWWMEVLGGDLTELRGRGRESKKAGGG